MPSQSRQSWICCQIGAREHYAIARGLHARGVLASLVTDAWVPPSSPLRWLPGDRLRRLGERYLPALADAPVCAFNRSLLTLELRHRARRRDDYWPAILERNEWFQDRALEHVRRRGGFEAFGSGGVVYAYSYAARRILAAAKAAGWTTILGQIDPGPIEEEIVTAHERGVPELRSRSRPAPAAYWRHWREECDEADHIVVNSSWSASTLARVGIDSGRIQVVPLPYESEARGPEPRRYPPSFSHERPLRVLFLGSAIVRKGIAEVLAASRLLVREPIEFHCVGPLGIEVPPADRDNPKIHWHGPVARSATCGHYDAADVFLFPTLSDGFGLTQLEARSRGLPIISSRHCGAVVTDGEDGRVLSAVTADALVETLTWCLESPAVLERMSAAALAPDPRFAPDTVISQLVQLAGGTR